MPSKPKAVPPIVFDTNALISAAILPDSVTMRSLHLAVTHYQLIVTEATWLEFETRIKRPHLARYFENDRHRDEVVLTFNRVVEHVESHSVVTDCKDPDDNKFLALALDGGAKIIVTGDKALLTLSPWRDVEVLTPRQFD
jgi:uncharacterized protein